MISQIQSLKQDTIDDTLKSLADQAREGESKKKEVAG
jgi:hypothetical protein